MRADQQAGVLGEALQEKADSLRVVQFAVVLERMEEGADPLHRWADGIERGQVVVQPAQVGVWSTRERSMGFEEGAGRLNDEEGDQCQSGGPQLLPLLAGQGPTIDRWQQGDELGEGAGHRQLLDRPLLGYQNTRGRTEVAMIPNFFRTCYRSF